MCVCLNAYISLSYYRCTELWPTRWGIRPQPFELSCAVGRMWQHGSVTCWQCACRVVAQFMNGMATENPYNKTRVMMDEGHNVAQVAVAMNNHIRCVSNGTGSFFLTLLAISFDRISPRMIMLGPCQLKDRERKWCLSKLQYWEL